MWKNIRYGIKRVWDRRKRWLREGGTVMLPESGIARAALHPCVAHRGWSGEAPENTLAAFRLAMREPAVQWIELDVQLSRDEVPVVIHDPTLKRTTGAAGRVSALTAAQLGELDAGSWFDPKFAGERIPTLDRVLELTAGRCRLNIELKGDDAPADRIASRVMEAVACRSMTHDVVITSFRRDILRAVRALSPDIATGLIIEDNPPGLISSVRELGASFLSIGFRHLTQPLLAEAADAGIAVMAWTVDQPAALRRLVRRPEPILICTNRPDRWLAAVEGNSDT